VTEAGEFTGRVAVIIPTYNERDNVEYVGYCFQIDLARRAVQAGLAAAEVPITFVERAHGVSKMSKAIVGEALWRVTRWGIMWRLRRYRTRRLRGLTVLLPGQSA